MKLNLEAYIGVSIEQVIPDLARLRIRVFKEFPYLYQGSLEYEHKYLQTYLECPDSLIVVVRDGETIVGASSALPLGFETIEVQQPFLTHGFDPKTVLYLGESVLLAEYRGQGLGHQFFDARETHAKAIKGCAWTAFCAVQRATDHPLRPSNHRDLDGFWASRGYAKHPELNTHFSWQEIGEQTESLKPMTFWLKKLEL